MKKIFFLNFLILSLFLQSVFADGHIFVLHRFDDNRYSSTSITSKQLTEDFEYFQNHGYKVVPLSEIVAKIEIGENIPDNWVSFTIDDGYRSFYTNGFEIFKKFNFHFTLLLYTEAIDKNYPDFMSWEEVKDIIEYGDIAIHSHTHPHLTHLEPLAIMKDTQNSIDSFLYHLDKLPEYYAYPYGEYTKSCREIIEAFGFKAILNQTTGAVSQDSDIFSLNRTALLGEHDISKSLDVKYLNATWIYPNKIEDNFKLSKIEIVIPSGIDKVQLYISGYGWQKLKVKKDGLIKQTFKQPIKLKYKRTRLFIKTSDNRWSGHIIVL
jgi:peptidoglycan/xylan/chitin deacetylase (PgdA/CDA1 family)